jgi:nucleoid-associated protein YgaU
MTRTTSLALAALLPVTAAAQLGAIDAAKEAGAKSDAGNARIERAADQQLGAGEQRPVGSRGTGQVTLDGKKAEGSAAAADKGLGAVPPPDTYTVRPGDTLWDLSGRFLNNPWYWPKVWSFNPEITNPHWIEPGNVLRFYPSAEEAPARVEPVPGAEAAPAVAEEPEAEAPRELEDFSKADMKAPAPVEEQEEVAVAGPYKVGYVAPKTIMVRRDAFVTQREVEESGHIVAAFEEKLMLSTLDRAYANFKSAADLVPGETYVVYKTERAVYHPITKEMLGYQSTILGTAKAIAVDGKVVTVVVGQTLEPIERGALLGPWTERFLRPVTQKPNGRDLQGRIVGTPIDVLTMAGEHHVVFIDKGKRDGVEEGNVFRVVRSGDPYGLPIGAIEHDPAMPKEIVGDLMVIDVKETTCSALVTRSLRELVLGDRVEMRAAAGAGGN